MRSPTHPIAIVSRPKLKGLWQHVGVLLPDGRVAHCGPGRGEHVSSVEEFARGEDVSILRALSEIEHAHVLQRLAEALRVPRQYDALQNNREMFANRVTGQPATSPQLRATMCLAALAAALLIAAAP